MHFYRHTNFLVKLQCFVFVFSGPQLNVDSDDEDTPFEDSDNDDSNFDEETIDSDAPSPSDAEVPFFVRQPSPIPRSFVSEKDKNARFVVADFVSSESRFSKGHLCLNCKEKPPLFVCSVCKNNWYCSTSCQIKDWPRHQTKCSKEKPEKSKKESEKFVKTAHPQLIKFPLPSELLASVTEEEISGKTRQTKTKMEKSTNCLKCRQNLPYFLCSVCRNFWYCSHKCHHDHWDEHQKYCTGKLNTNVHF